MRNYYHKNKKEIQAYRKKTRKQRNSWRRKYMKNPLNNIAQNLRRRLRGLIKKDTKTSSVLQYIGCSLDKLKIHLESQFVPGMNWDNYGLWHIDHKIPCILFDLTKNSERQKCFNYKNLQPLWAKENLSKGSKYVY